MQESVSSSISKLHGIGVHGKEINSAHDARGKVKKQQSKSTEKTSRSLLPAQGASLDPVKPNVFLKSFANTLSYAQQTCSMVSSRAIKDLLRHNAYKIISNDAISYICNDLATQDADDRNTCETNASEQGTRPSWNPKKLLRFIVFAFAYSLSSSQRKNITELLTRKLSRNRAKLLKQDEYFSLLRMVDDLRSYSSPKVLDSQFVNVVEDVVNLLVDIVSGKRHSFPDTKTSILFLLLEARFLLFTASGAYKVLSKTTELENLSKKCQAYSEKVLLADLELYAAINCVMGIDELARLEPSSIVEAVPPTRALAESNNDTSRGIVQNTAMGSAVIDRGARPKHAIVTQGAITDAKSRLRKTKSPAESNNDTSRGIVQNTAMGSAVIDRGARPKRAIVTQEAVTDAKSRLRKTKSPAESSDTSEDTAQLSIGVRRLISFINNQKPPGAGEETLFPSCEVQKVGLGLKENKKTVVDIYNMVKHDSPDGFSIVQSQELMAERNTSFGQQDFFMSGVQCSKAISHYIKKFVEDISKRKSARFIGEYESSSVAAMYARLTDKITSFEKVECLRRYEKSFASSLCVYNAEIFRDFVSNIGLNLVCGDVYRVFGTTSLGANHVNYRVLGLFVSIFGTLPPTFMNDARALLTECFAKYGENLPEQIDDILCVLTDLKYFSYKSSYIKNDAGRNDKENPLHSNQDTGLCIEILTTLAMLLARYAYCNKTNMWKKRRENDVCSDSEKSGTVGLLDIIKVLLCECANLADMSSAIDNGGSIRQNEKMRLGRTSKNRRCLKQVSTKVLKVLNGKELRTIRDFLGSEVKICNKISECREELGKLLGKFSVKGRDTQIRYPCVVAALKDSHDRVWDTCTNSALSNKKVDEQLVAHLICKSYTSASLALNIMQSCSLRLEKPGSTPTLDDVLKEYFQCYTIKNPTRASATLESNECYGINSFAQGQTTANVNVRSGPSVSEKTAVARVRASLANIIGNISANGNPVQELKVEEEGVSNKLNDTNVVNVQRSCSQRDCHTRTRGDVSVVRVCGVAEDKSFTIRLLFHDQNNRHVADAHVLR